MWRAVITLVHGGERVRAVPLLTWRARLKGLLGRARLRRDVAVLFVPCHAVHTFGMQFALDIFFLDRDFTVLRVVPGLRPGRLAMCFGAYCVVECASRTDESIATLTLRATAIADRARDLACARARVDAPVAQCLVVRGVPSVHSMAEDASSASSAPCSRGRLSMSNTDT